MRCSPCADRLRGGVGPIVQPAGIYHRFSLDANGRIHVMRLFQAEPKWTPHPRPADQLPSRKSYLELIRAANGQ